MMEIICKFVQQEDTSIYYKIIGQDIPEKIIDIKTTHPPGKSNKDVTYLNIDNCEIKRIPQGLTNIFPNLQILHIEDTNLDKIYKNDLMEYKNLKVFCCRNNSIELLVGNLFEDFNDLQKIYFNGNDIKVIEPTILDGLNSLYLVDFSNNDNYDCCYSIDQRSTDLTLNDLKQKLFETFFSSDPENIKTFIKKFQNRIQRLSVSNKKLRIKVQKLDELEQKLRIINQKISEFEENEAALRIENKNLKAVNQQFQNKAANDETNLNIAKRQIKLLIETQEVIKAKNIERNKIKIKVASKQSKQVQSSFNSDIKKFLQNQNFKDFHIQIDDQEFKVHKFILAARSPTLAEIFLKNPDAENLKLVDITPETFEIILHFMYTDELPGDDKINYLQLYSAAGRLEINELKIFAEPKAFESLNPDNAVEILVLSNKFKNNEMREKAFELIKKAHPEVPDVWIDKPEKVKKFIQIFGES